MLAPAGDGGLDTDFGESRPDLGDRRGEERVALGRPGADEIVELGVALRVEGGEGEVFELLLDLLHPEAVGQRGVDVDRLLGDAMLLLSGHRRDRAHVVQPVGELDDEDAQVGGHRHEHLAHRRRLLGLPRVELDAVELGDAVDDGGDLLAEVPVDVGDGDLGVLDGVVQQGGNDGHLVEADVGDDAGDCQGVIDVALAARTELVAMRVGGDLVGVGDRRDRCLRVATAVGGEQWGQLGGRGRLVVPPPGQDAVDGSHARPLTSSPGSPRRTRQADRDHRGRPTR